MFNVLPWRILFIVDELDSRYQIAAGWDEAEIMTNWSYLEKESCPQLAEMENQEDQARVLSGPTWDKSFFHNLCICSYPLSDNFCSGQN